MNNPLRNWILIGMFTAKTEKIIWVPARPQKWNNLKITTANPQHVFKSQVTQLKPIEPQGYLNDDLYESTKGYWY